ncbi:hypothetical protein ABMA27_001125 [Loxostege sticticalis]|uniref:Reverse transcriptase domain-containing protein n=1 Tax=Loxostege sticticalis TaxID=481309 RepID=A0ABR3I1K9_LOXSC
MFADDLCTLRAGTDLADTCCLVQRDIDAVVKWSHDNGIILNSDKTNLLIIHSPYLRPTGSPPFMYTHSFSCLHNDFVCCNCMPIKEVNCVTYLGVKVDNIFSWSHHVDYICNKLRLLLCKFYHLRFKVPTSTLKLLYLSLVEPILGYALDSYGLTFKTHIDKLEVVNNKTKANCKGNYYKLFKICRILLVSLKHKYLLAINNHDSQENSPTLVNHSHCTRSMSAGKFEVPKVNNFFGDRTLKKRLPYLLNSLPEDIRREQDKNVFKRNLKKYFIANLA